MEHNKHIWTVIMAGGLGSRFWPISRTDNPKQFIDVMGVGSSMLQLTFQRFQNICPKEHIVVVTGEQYANQVADQIVGLEPWQILREPLRRNTAPCIAYAAATIKARDPEAIVIVSPADHAIFGQQRFEADIMQAVSTAAQHDWIITFGAQPTRPDTSYGYIQFGDQPSLPTVTNLHKAITFTEKPPVDLASQFIASGEFFWNTGLLVWRMPVLEQAYNKYLPQVAEAMLDNAAFATRTQTEAIYAVCEAISVDRGIMEKADNVHVIEASFGWSDVETWESLYDVSRRDTHANVLLGSGNVFTYDTSNCLVTMPENTTAVVEGLDGYIVAYAANTLMICRRGSEEQVFRFASDVELKNLIDSK